MLSYPTTALAVPAGHMLIEHQLSSFLQTEQLELHRTHAGNRPKVLPEGSRTHVRVFGKLLHSHLFGEVLPDPCDGFCDLLCRTWGINEAPQVRRVRSGQQANDDFLLDKWSKLRNQRWLIKQRKEPMESIEHRGIQPLYPYRLKNSCLARPYGLEFGRNLRDQAHVELEHDSQVGFSRRGVCDVVRDGQIDGREK